MTSKKPRTLIPPPDASSPGVSGTRLAVIDMSTRRRRPAEPRPADPAAPPPSADVERLISLLMFLRDAGPTLVTRFDPQWGQAIFEAIRAGFVRHARRQANSIELTDQGRQRIEWDPAEHVVIKVTAGARMAGKQTAARWGTLEQESNSGIMTAVGAVADELRSIALREGIENPWDAIPLVVRRYAK